MTNDQALVTKDPLADCAYRVGCNGRETASGGLVLRHWESVILWSLVIGTWSFAQSPKPVPRAVEHRPTAIPDRIVLTWTGDPARSQAVTWRTDTSVTKPVAQFAVTEPNKRFETAKRYTQVPAVTTPLKSDLGEAHYHSAAFEGLAPKTKYVYRVGDGVNWSEWIHFTTASDRPEPFSFIYFGDAQNEVKAHWSRVIREAYGDAPDARFIVHAGDLINSANSDAEWGEWFGAGGWLNAMVPSVPTPGNHEYRREAKDKPNLLSRHWRPQFALPENGPYGLEETTYFLDYQGVRLISLNSNEKQVDQVPWLEDVLGANPNRWTIVTFHHPIYSTARKRDNAKLRSLWQPVFDKYRVDLVLQGHDHSYGRSGLMTAENAPTGAMARDPRGGTVYVVSVSGPKTYALNPQPWMRRSAQDTQLYQILHVDGDRLGYEARTATGELYDRFELRKRPGWGNALVEREELEVEVRSGPAVTPAGVLAALVVVLLALVFAAAKTARRALA